MEYGVLVDTDASPPNLEFYVGGKHVIPNAW